jgi:hypothetical protein
VRRFYHKYLKTQYISFTIPLDSSYKPLLQEDFTLSAILEKPPDTVGELKVPKFVWGALGDAYGPQVTSL